MYGRLVITAQFFIISPNLGHRDWPVVYDKSVRFTDGAAKRAGRAGLNVQTALIGMAPFRRRRVPMTCQSSTGVLDVWNGTEWTLRAA